MVTAQPPLSSQPAGGSANSPSPMLPLGGTANNPSPMLPLGGTVRTQTPILPLGGTENSLSSMLSPDAPVNTPSPMPPPGGTVGSSSPEPDRKRFRASSPAPQSMSRVVHHSSVYPIPSPAPQSIYPTWNSWVHPGDLSQAARSSTQLMNPNINSGILTASSCIEKAAPQSPQTVFMESLLAPKPLHHGPGLQSLQHHTITQVLAIVIISVYQ